MANDYLDDHEQGEAVKKFIQQHGSSLVVGVVLGLGGLFGFQQYQGYKQTQRADAALQYAVLEQARSDGNGNFVIEAAERIRKDYRNTPYAGFAAMAQADVHITREELDLAEVSLRWAMERSQPEDLRTVAGVRLARVLIADNRAQEALDMLDSLKEAGFAAQIHELRGDALMVLERMPEARSAYEEALTQMPTGAAQRNVVEMKFNDLAVVGEAG